MPSKHTAFLSLFAVLAVFTPVQSAPATVYDRALAVSFAAENSTTTDFSREDVIRAQNFNLNFGKIGINDNCQFGDATFAMCVNSQLAECRNTHWELSPCGENLSCFFIPQKGSPGIKCLTVKDANKLFEDTGVPGGPKGDVLYTSADIRKQDALDAQKINGQFKNLHANDTCQSGSVACIDLSLATCKADKWELSQCGTSLACLAFPLIQANGTAVGCLTGEDAKSRFDAAGVTGGPNGSDTMASSIVIGSSSTSVSSSASRSLAVSNSATSTSSLSGAITASASVCSAAVTVTVTNAPSSSPSTITVTIFSTAAETKTETVLSTSSY